MESNEGQNEGMEDKVEQASAAKAQPRRKKASKGASKAPLLHVADVQALLRSTLDAGDDMAKKIAGRLEGSGVAYLTEGGEKIIAVCLSPAEYDRILKR